MYLKIQGLVLRRTEYKDHDVLLTLLTREHGKLTAKARGLRRKNSPLTAQCQLLAYSEFTLFEYRGMYTINEAVSLELFHDLRRDLTRLSLATYFAQVAEVLSQEDMPSPELQSLVLNCLYGLSKLAQPEDKVKAVFELRAACIAGPTAVWNAAAAGTPAPMVSECPLNRGSFRLCAISHPAKVNGSSPFDCRSRLWNVLRKSRKAT